MEKISEKYKLREYQYTGNDLVFLSPVVFRMELQRSYLEILLTPTAGGKKYGFYGQWRRTVQMQADEVLNKNDIVNMVNDINDLDNSEWLVANILTSKRQLRRP